MQIKKIFKYLSIIVIVAGLTIVTSTTLLPLINNPHYQKNQSFNVDLQVDDTNYSNQLEYIRKDVEKQKGVNDSVTSINLVDSSSSSNYSAALVTKTDGSTLLYMWGDNRHHSNPSYHLKRQKNHTNSTWWKPLCRPSRWQKSIYVRL